MVGVSTGRQTTPDDYTWSGHLRDRMREREIIEEQVMMTLNSVHPSVSGTTGSLCYRHTFEDGRTLKVWVKACTHTPRVIKSAAWEGDE